MARNKEALVLVLDVGPSMHCILPEVEKLCAMLMEKKLVYSKNDEVGVVLFGTTDAVIVGIDMLIKKFDKTIKWSKRLCLITNATFPIKEPDNGTKKAQVKTVAEYMTSYGMKMDSIVFRGKQVGDANTRIMEENDILLNIFSKTVYVETPISLLGALPTRRISPATIYRGDLEMSPEFKIKIWIYKKTSEEKFPTLKKYFDEETPVDEFANHKNKLEYKYKTVEDPSKVVPPKQRIKGYSYGPQVIPVPSDVLEAAKFKPEKGVKFLGVTDASKIMRHHYMKDVNIVIGDPNDENAIIAVSALARAMKELDKVAILRCVWRKGQGNVVIGVLTPNLSDKDNVPDSFYFNTLPFTEDVREFQFPSFSKFPSSRQPTEQQQKVADNLVRMLNLAPPGKEEALRPEFTPNPSLQRFYHHLELKSKDSHTAVPPVDETLKRITEPDPELFSGAKSFIDDFCQHFEVQEKAKLKKSTRQLMREKTSGSSEDGGRLAKNYDNSCSGF